MDIQAEKIHLIKALLEVENPKVLRFIKKILKNQKDDDFWDELSPVEKKIIRRGAKEIDEGNYRSLNDVLKKYD